MAMGVEGGDATAGEKIEELGAGERTKHRGTGGYSRAIKKPKKQELQYVSFSHALDYFRSWKYFLCHTLKGISMNLSKIVCR